jgi:hypothetical protein
LPQTVKVAEWTDAVADAVIVPTNDAGGWLVVMGKLAVVAPAGIVIAFGTTTKLEFELKLTFHPPVGAGEVSVTVPVEPIVATTGLGPILKVEMDVAGTGTV